MVALGRRLANSALHPTSDDRWKNGLNVSVIEGNRNMDRRAFLSICGASLLATPIATAEAQHEGKTTRIGYLSTGTATANAGLRKAFTDGLRDHGWMEEKNVVIEYRYEGAGKPTLDVLAAELVQRPGHRICSGHPGVYRYEEDGDNTSCRLRHCE